MQARINSPPFDQFVVCTLFCDPPLVQHDNHVRIFHRGNPMADDDARPVLHDRPETAENRLFRVGIDGRKCIVQDENFRFSKYGPGDARPLLLASRQRYAPFAEHCLELMGKLVHVFGDLRYLGGFVDLLSRHAVDTVTDVLGDGFRKEKRFLRHIPDMRTKNFERDFLDADPVDQDLTFRCVV